MANEHRFTVAAHPSIYVDNPPERSLDIVFTEPGAGINDQTGILLLIAGFGESLDDDKYREARDYLSDQHNMVAVQCNYFGYEFMQDAKNTKYVFDVNVLQQVFSLEEFNEIYDGQNVDINQIFSIGRRYPINIEGTELLNETENYFNDMGVMQALDQLTAIYAVNAVLSDNGFNINNNRIHAYGQGHGAYLAYLANALVPELFNCIVDNSSWLYPSYLENGRVLSGKIGELSFSINFPYLASSLGKDNDLLHLPTLYRLFRNQCRIIAYFGSRDHMTPANQKEVFCKSLRLCTYNVIRENSPSSEVFASSELGLGADFKYLYDFAIKENTLLGQVTNESRCQETVIETRSYRYIIDFTSGMPFLSRNKK